MSSTFSPVSEGSALASNIQACEPSPSAKSIPTAAPSSDGIGLESPSTPTSESSTEPLTRERSTSSAGAIPASPSASPENSAAARIKDTSGRKCIVLYERSGRDGSWPRMLLDILNSVSTRLPHRWKLKATPSGRLLFQLVPLTHLIGGIGCGFLPTPTAQTRGRPEIAKQLALSGQPLYKRRDKEGSGRQFSLVDFLIYQSLLPTPMASDFRGASDNCKRIKEGHISYLRYYLHFHLQPPGLTSYPHPSFVERMMGYPIGHTALDASATPSFRKSQHTSAKRSCASNKRNTTFTHVKTEGEKP